MRGLRRTCNYCFFWLYCKNWRPICIKLNSCKCKISVASFRQEVPEQEAQRTILVQFRQRNYHLVTHGFFFSRSDLLQTKSHIALKPGFWCPGQSNSLTFGCLCLGRFVIRLVIYPYLLIVITRVRRWDTSNSKNCCILKPSVERRCSPRQILTFFNFQGNLFKIWIHKIWIKNQTVVISCPFWRSRSGSKSPIESALLWTSLRLLPSCRHPWQGRWWYFKEQ